MAADNNLLGQFDLVGIPPAPRGVPQIEVSFDIDANGIVNVGAADKGTGKEQQITIRSSGGLSKDDMEKMSQNAEKYAEEDKKKRESVEAKNDADALVHNTRKNLNEHKANLPDDVQEAVNAGITALEEKIANDESSVEDLRTAISELETSAMKMGEAIYKTSSDQAAKDKEEATKDAEFKDVKDDDKKEEEKKDEKK